MKTAIVATVLLLCGATLLSASEGSVRKREKARAGYYNVFFNDRTTDPVAVLADDLAKAHQITPVALWTRTTKGCSVQMTPQQAAAVAKSPHVDFVEEDSYVTLSVTTPRWQLDRIDNRMSPRLDGVYNYCSGADAGRGVRAYVVDTGVWAGHDEFSNPNPDTGGPRVELGWDFQTGMYGNRSNNPCTWEGRDVNNYAGSHGTAVASVLGGRTMGSAPQVTIVPVRFLDCYGNGFTSSLISGLDWIPTDRPDVAAPRLINLSHVTIVGMLQGDGTVTDTAGIERSIRGLLSIGYTVIAAAGNQNEAVGEKYSPARMPEVITVGGSKGSLPGDVDKRWGADPGDGDANNPGSNYGPVIDIFAPAHNITAAHWNAATSIRAAYTYGTSFAAPLVAGVAARWLSIYPNLDCAGVSNYLTTSATSTEHGLDLAGRMNSPNRLLYKGMARCVRPSGS